MLLPITVHGRVSDIWRSYIAQRLLWDLGVRVGFQAPWVIQHRNAHNYLKDFQSELDLYLRCEALLQSLSSWRNYAATLEERLEDIMVMLYERGFIGYDDVVLAQQWMVALQRAGYVFPRPAVGDAVSSELDADSSGRVDAYYTREDVGQMNVAGRQHGLEPPMKVELRPLEVRTDDKGYTRAVSELENVKQELVTAGASMAQMAKQLADATERLTEANAGAIEAAEVEASNAKELESLHKSVHEAHEKIKALEAAEAAKIIDQEAELAVANELRWREGGG